MAMQAAGTTELTVGDFARCLGVSKVVVQQAITDGRLSQSVRKVSRDGRGRPAYRIHFERGRAEWAAGAVQDMPEGEVPPHDGSLGADPLLRELGEARRRTAEAQRLLREEDAQLKRIKRLKLEGSLVDRGLVMSEVYRTARGVRDELLTIPERVADQVLSTRDRQEVVRILSQSIEEALRALLEVEGRREAAGGAQP